MAKDADVVVELKKSLAANKLVLGTDETVKLLRKGKVHKVILASNCDPQVRGDIQKYCGIGGVECVELPQTNEELGVLCKKPFAISVVGVTA